MAITSTPLTLEQFLALPEEEPPLEFADGVVSQKVSPKTRHSALQAELVERLNQREVLRIVAEEPAPHSSDRYARRAGRRPADPT